MVRVLASALVVIALAVPAAGAAQGSHGRTASQGSCPHDASLGTVSFPRGANQHTVSLASCANRVTGKATLRFAWANVGRSRQGHVAAIIATRPQSKIGTATVTVDGHPVYRVREDYRSIPGGVPGPLGLVGWSPDGRWLFFYIDPMGSSSIAADGLELRALRVADAHMVRVTTMLMTPDYLTWCGSTLVLTAGANRLATTNKRLVTARAPDWRPRPLWADPTRSYGSVTCSPDGKKIAVLSQPVSNDYHFFSTKWRLWQVGLNGARRLLDVPPKGSADESPQWSRNGGSLLFVRERQGRGQLVLRRGGRTTGPFANLGYSLGYYGHHLWQVDWSAGA